MELFKNLNNNKNIKNGLLTINQASKWASKYFNKNITPSNISYLIQYGRIKKINNNGTTLIYKSDLINYYKNSYVGKREIDWKKKLGDDLNWHLSFDYLKEAETTKHVHRLHPYKGKFIPQLVEYFLDEKTDEFKQSIYFKKGDIILDPFCGSGTTLVQANELGMHSVGIDISHFNTLISNIKIQKVDFAALQSAINKISTNLKQYISMKNNLEFENELLDELNKFNNKYFPSPEYKYKVRKKEIDEKEYGKEKAYIFLCTYKKLISKYEITVKQDAESQSFLNKWFLQPVRDEIDFVHNQINKIPDNKTKEILMIILSRTVRSCRATTHADLATLKEPVTTTYYCRKHGKICKPLFSIINWWERYTKDTVKRLIQFSKLRTRTYQICITGDSRTINIIKALEKKYPQFSEIVKKQKINGIFSSPPYVGLIDYHEQHAYSYDLFGFGRKDNLEIGPLYRGKGKDARESYI